MSNFKTNVIDCWLKYLLWNWPQMNIIGPHCQHGLVPPGNPFWISIVFCHDCHKNLMHCFITTLRLFLHIDVFHQASACCPRSWAQAEWIFNHIRDTFPANDLQWVGMSLKQCRLLSIKTVSGTCSINHQWTPDIVSILILMRGMLAFASL